MPLGLSLTYFVNSPNKTTLQLLQFMFYQPCSGQIHFKSLESFWLFAKHNILVCNAEEQFLMLQTKDLIQKSNKLH